MKRITIGALFACLCMSSVALAQQTPEQTPPPDPTVAPEKQTPPPVVEPAPQQNTTIIENQQPAPQPTTIVEPPPPAPVVVQPTEKHEWFNTQIGLEVGGGYADFTPSSRMENATNGGGEWDARLLFGAHSPLGIELGYIGTANGLHSVMGGGTLTSNAAEANLRLGTPGWIRMPVQIYGFAGAGINRWDVVNSSGSSSAGTVSFREQDTNFVLPFGGGFQFNLHPHLSLDTRFTYRAMFDTHVAGMANSDLDMLTATARLGYVF